MELIEFLNIQSKLDKYISDKKSLNINKETLIAYLTQALQVEAAELANAIRAFKFWSEKKEYDRDKVLEEYIDVFHFFLSLGNNLGFTAKEIEDTYLKKNTINFNRQDNGY